MYQHIWKKYLPVIKILMKKSAASQQVLEIDRVDFEKAGAARKAGNKCYIEFHKGKVTGTVGNAAMAMNLASTLQEDDTIRQILQDHHYSLELNTRFQLIIRDTTPQSPADVTEQDGTH